MAISTIDGLIAGFKPTRLFTKSSPGTIGSGGRPISTWALAGIPGPGSYDTTLNGVVLSSSSALVAGQLPFYDPAGGSNTYLSKFAVTPATMGMWLLCDRLWHNGGYTITSTSAQNSTTPTWPARDDDGSTNGKGVYLGLEISSATGSGTPAVTVTYTNSAGTGSRVSGLRYGASTAGAANTPATIFYPIGLQAGDLGVRSLQSIQLSATWTSGTMNMVAYRVLAVLTNLGSSMAAIDALTSGMPQLFNGTVPFLLAFPTGASTSTFSGALAVAQG